jgi:hypothetical protein
LRLSNEALTNRIARYTNLVATMEVKLNEAIDGAKKRNAAIKALVGPRDEFAQKSNASAKDRNEIVGKPNEVV